MSVLGIHAVLRESMRARITGNPKIIIIGSGIGGLTMAYRLRRAGVTNFEIFEKSDDVGGTWRDNRYPGVACDIPSHLYTLTFFRNPGWTQLNAPGAEIHDYLRRLARRFRLGSHLRFGKEVVRCDYSGGQWRVETSDGAATTADVIVAATGFLHIPVVPDIAGMDTFAGALMHNARWNADVPIDGRRVAVIGTGSSGVQLVSAIVDRVAKVDVYQRTAQWIFPLPNQQYTRWERLKRRLFPRLTQQIFNRYLEEFDAGLGRAVMGDTAMQKVFHDACAQNLATVKDPELRRRLTPDYPVLCKRLVFSDRFYSAIQQPNCELVTDSIAQIEPAGIRTREGTLREVDVIVTSTGYETHEFCRRIRIRGERAVDINQAWAGGACSFEAAALAGFPNFFMVGGPQTTIGNLSYTACAELQASYIVRVLQLRSEAGVRGIVPTEAAQQRFLADMRRSAGRTVWKSGCTSWYLDGQGGLDVWPKSVPDFIAMMAKGPRRQDFHLIR